MIETKKTESAQAGLADTGSAGPVACVLDRSRLDRILWQLWTEYQRDFEVRPITEIQDLRAFSILWVSTFVPEVVSVPFRNALTRAVWQYRARNDYASFCASRILPMEAALYALTGEDSCLEIVTESLALVANRLVFDAEMLRRIAHNLEVKHFFCEWPVILFATSKGDPDSKRQQVRKWLDTYDLNGDERDVLQKLVRGLWVVNPFLNRLLRTQQFMTLRLAGSIAAPAETPVQLPMSPPDQGELDLYDDPLDISVVWKRLSGHPLTAAMIKIEGVNPE
jgi:hypothetical protein